MFEYLDSNQEVTLNEGNFADCIIHKYSPQKKASKQFPIIILAGMGVFPHQPRVGDELSSYFYGELEKTAQESGQDVCAVFRPEVTAPLLSKKAIYSENGTFKQLAAATYAAQDLQALLIGHSLGAHTALKIYNEDFSHHCGAKKEQFPQPMLVNPAVDAKKMLEGHKLAGLLPYCPLFNFAQNWNFPFGVYPFSHPSLHAGTKQENPYTQRQGSKRMINTKSAKYALGLDINKEVENLDNQERPLIIASKGDLISPYEEVLKIPSVNTITSLSENTGHNPFMSDENAFLRRIILEHHTKLL